MPTARGTTYTAGPRRIPTPRGALEVKIEHARQQRDRFERKARELEEQLRKMP